MDMRSPALPAGSLNASIKIGITGGTLNWFREAAVVAARTINRIIQGMSAGTLIAICFGRRG